jgi:hypothetical protein|tara:strand:+ start:249 stop:545 length:297 start_codon:yes stop_codon:yes gene_type:complete
MSRPKPKTLLQYTGKKNYKMEEVLEAIAIYAVFYQGNPINLKSSSIISNYPGPKYKKVSFSNPGHAHNLAQKLNAMFKCSDFEVYQLDSGKLLKDETY